MIFVIPVSAVDFDKLFKFTKVLQHFGGLKNHKVVLLPTAEVSAGVRPFIKQYQELFGSVEFATVPTPIPGSWPYPCNQHFKSAVEILRTIADSPWMWLELDSCPLKPEWADDLHFQYTTKGRAFLGVVRDTSEVMEGGDGTHMVGFGIYPPNFHQYTNLWQYPDKNIPFDVLMRYDIAPYVYHTNLIAHHWGSRNYQPDMTGMDAFGNQVIVSREAIILHGVKDDSLYDIILGEKEEVKVVEEKIERHGNSLKEKHEQWAKELREHGYFVVSPDAMGHNTCDSEELIPQSTEVKATTQTKTVETSPPPKPLPSPNNQTNLNVQLPKRRGRPKLAK